MSAEVQVVTTTDNSQTVGAFTEVEQKAKDSGEAIDNTNKATKSFTQELRQLKKEQDGLDLDERIKRVKDIFDNAAPSVDKLTAEVKEYQSLALAAGRESPVGREFLEKAAQAKDQLVDLQNETKRLSDDNRNLQGAIQGIGVGVSAFAGVTAAAALFGDKNEELQRLLVRVTAAQTLLNSVQQIQVALQKESSLRLALTNAQVAAQAAGTAALTAAQGVYNAVVGTSTGALKAFRLALVSTGIGALVVGIGLLIANFDTVVEFVGSAIDSFGGLKNVLMILLGPINLVIAAFEFLFGATEDQAAAEEELEEQRRKASEENSKRTKREIEDIKKKQKILVESAKKENEVLEVRVKILENQGKASDEAALKILENNRAIVASELDAVQKIIDARIRQFQTEAEIRGKTEEEFKAQLLAQGVDLENLQERATEIVTDLQLDLELSESEITKFKREQNEERTKGSKAAADAEKKIQDDLLKRQIDAIAKLDEINIKLIDDRTEREEAALQLAFERRIAKLDENIAEEQALIKGLEEQFLNDLQSLRDKAAQEEAKAEFEQAQKLDQLRIQILEQKLSKEAEQELILKEIENFKFQEELENLRFELESKEITEDEFRLREELLVEEHQATLTEIEKKASEERKKQALEEANKKIDIASFFVNSAVKLNDLFNQIQDNQLKESEELSLKAQKRRFQREKAFNIASALINGAKAVTQSIAQFGPPPSPLGLAGIASAGIITAAQVAAIATQKFNPSGGSSGGGGSSSVSGGFAPTVAAAPTVTPNIPTTQTNGVNESGEESFGGTSGGGNNQQVIQAFVIPGQLTTAQEAEALINEQSIL